ncbi:MAG: patatin family protein [Prevotella sp.]|nr:patatin family protein [Prevotella sp.]
MKKALVLEGGALRGLFSAGVMDVMMEHNITFDGVVGVSAGAAFGSNFVSQQQGRSIRYNKRFAKDWRYCSIRSWLTTGDLFGAEYAYHILPSKLDIFDNEAFEKSPMAFYVVCTDVETGKAVYKRCDKGGHDFFDWVRASASMPFVSRIVELEGHKMLDGGVADSIPLRFMESEGYSHNVVILTQPEGYQKQHNRLMPLLRFSLRKYPLMVEALDKRHLMYNEQTAYVRKREAEGDAFVIRPDAPLPIGHTSHDPEKMQHVYDLGRQMAKQKMQDLKAFLFSPKTS